MLAARYLDGSMDALELLLGSEPGSQSGLAQHGQHAPQHELQLTSLSTHNGPGASTAQARNDIQAASEQRQCRTESIPAAYAKAEDTSGPEASDTGFVSTPSEPDVHEPGGGIPCRHASELSYDDFVLQYMGPNLPVMIQVSPSCWMAMKGIIRAERARMHAGQAKILSGLASTLCCLRDCPASAGCDRWLAICSGLGGCTGRRQPGGTDQAVRRCQNLGNRMHEVLSQPACTAAHCLKMA